MVKNFNLAKHSATSVYMTWDQPDKTNGVILLYEVEMWATNNDKSKSQAQNSNSIIRQVNLIPPWTIFTTLLQIAVCTKAVIYGESKVVCVDYFINKFPNL